jgi:integral membrane protein (TIGR01906 family)
MATLGHRLGSFVVSLATALGIVVLVLPLFVNPVWVSFEQGRADAVTWTGFTPDDLRVATDAILADLVLGPPDFDVEVGGEAVLVDRERAHMRDVRSVFMGFFAATLALVVAAVMIAWRRRRQDRVATWRAVRSGALGLIIGLVLLGGYAFIAFDILFEVFHRLFFAGGTYLFDPATERLVQLFPFMFWQETAIAVGVAAAVVAVIVAVVAHRRMARAAATERGV